ncbi:hypothetical protein [Streptomyces sp. LHW50302]
MPRRRDRGSSGTRFITRLESANHGLYFEARITYGWQRVPEQGPLLYGDEVARSLLRDLASRICADYPVLLNREAQDAVNAELGQPICGDPRLEVTGRVRLSVADHTVAIARRRVEAAEQQRLAEAAETARLEILRERLLDQHLGPVWWVDRYADLQFATGDPKQKTKSVLDAYELIADLLRRTDPERRADDEMAALRARASELLATLEDPATRKRAGNLLEAMVATFTSPVEGTSDGNDEL